MQKPLLVFDGDCLFCSRQVELLSRMLPSLFDARSFRDPKFFEQFPEFTKSECELEIHFQSAEGRIFKGGEAVAQALGLAWPFAPLKVIYYVPGIRPLWNWAYRVISQNRIWLMR